MRPVLPSSRRSGRAVLIAGIVLLVLGGWAVSLCLHEFAHALVAYRSGDRSVRGTRLPDPRHPPLHQRRPDVRAAGPVPAAGRHPAAGRRGADQPRGDPVARARSLVSLAGPAVNLVLGWRWSSPSGWCRCRLGLAAGLSCLALIQVLAFVLNILPVPGLDGFGVLEPYLSAPAQFLAAKVRPWAPLVLLVVLLGLPGASAVLFGIGDVRVRADGRRHPAGGRRATGSCCSGGSGHADGAPEPTARGAARCGGQGHHRHPGPCRCRAAGRRPATTAGRPTRR